MKFAPYACLNFGQLKETILFPRLFPLHFTFTEYQLIEKLFKSFIDDGFFFMAKMVILIYLESF